MKLRTQLAIAFSLVALGSVIVGYAALAPTIDTRARVAHIQDVTAPAIRALDELRVGGMRIVSSTSEFALIAAEAAQVDQNKSAAPMSRKDSEIQGKEEIKLIEGARARFAQALERYRTLTQTPAAPNSGDEVFARVKKAASELLEHSDRVIDLKRRRVGGAEVLEAKEEFEQAESEFLAASDAAMQREEQGLARARSEVDDAFAGVIRKVLLALGLTLAGALALAFFLARRIARPIASLTQALQGVVGADPDGDRLPSDFAFAADARASGSEVAALSSAYRVMLERLRSSSLQIRHHQQSLETKVAERTAELELEKHRAEDASRTKSRFLANMSHEIRTPMNGVLGVADLLQHSSLNETQQRYVQMLKSSGQALLSILNDILDRSKLDAGRMTLEHVEFDIRALVKDIVALYEAAAHTKQVTLAAEIESGVPQIVAGDPVRMRQVLSNLVANAVKFTERGGVVVKVAAPDTEAPAPHIEFAVHDTGIGIDAKTQTELFQPFKQVDDSITRRFGGTGLGLAISKDLVELMGGRLRVQSEPGRGSVFSFGIPLRARVGTSSAAPIKVSVPAITPGLRVLLVEDNLVNQEVARATLELLGCKVRVADGGSQAVAATQTESFDIVLMDCQMPEVDGYEATRRIRLLEAAQSARERIEKRVPIVALTANAMRGDREECLAAGMDDYLSKPLVREELLEVLQRWGAPASAQATNDS